MRSPRQSLVWHCSHGHIDCLATRQIAGDQDRLCSEALALEQMRMERARSELPAPDALHWLDLTEPQPAYASQSEGPQLIPLVLPGWSSANKTPVNEAAVALNLGHLMYSAAP